jgi:hypothetical protein
MALSSKRPCRLQQARLEIDIGGGEALTVDHQFLHDRQRGRMGILYLADHRAEIEGELGLELAGELLHALVLHEAAYVQELDAAVARDEQAAFKQRRSDTQALPRLLDAEGGLGLAPVERPEDAQIGGAAQHPCTITSLPGAVAA